MKKVLFIGLVWPEHTSTAAGERLIRLLKWFLEDGYEVHFASAASPSERSSDLISMGCLVKEIKLNDSSFDEYITDLNPDTVLFDRFLSEEQFGWRVAQSAPNALRILDSEDLHFLRYAREKAVKKDLKNPELHTDLSKREIASIYRCDLTIIISTYEMHLLTSQFNVPADLLHYVPLLIDDVSTKEQLKSYAERQHFMTIGNFKHAPNLDSVKYLKQHIWPLIKKQMPHAIMDVYGAYISESALQWNFPKDGFQLRGAVPDADVVFKKYRVCLSPLRFGAGLKGKLLGAMKNGLPSITTAIGAEGIEKADEWPGIVAETPQELADAAVELYTNESLWSQCQNKGFIILETKFKDNLYRLAFLDAVKDYKANLPSKRKDNFIGQMMHYHSLRSTEYLSRWIELKNKK